MERFIPHTLFERDDHWLFDNKDGLQVEVYGGEARKAIAWRIIDRLEEISGRAVHLLDTFMRDRGRFELNSIEVFAAMTADGGDFLLNYVFTADRDSAEYNYTDFDVNFRCREPPQAPFWPFKFTVGFH